MNNGISQQGFVAKYLPDVVPDYVVRSRDKRLCTEAPPSMTEVAAPSRKFIGHLKRVEAQRITSLRRGWQVRQEGFGRFVDRFYVAAYRHPGGWTIERHVLDAAPGECCAPAM